MVDIVRFARLCSKKVIANTLDTVRVKRNDYQPPRAGLSLWVAPVQVSDIIEIQELKKSKTGGSKLPENRGQLFLEISSFEPYKNSRQSDS